MKVLRLRKRSLIALVLASAVGVVAFGWPFLADPASTLADHSADAPYLFVVLLPLIVAVVLAELTDGGMDAKSVALLGVLAAVGAALRILSPATIGFEPAFFLLILAGRVFGAGFGFALGALIILSSSLVTGGVGPWMPFQMFGLGWVGLLAGLLPRASGWPERWLLAAYAAATGFAYGALLNLWFWPFSTTLAPGLSYVPGASLWTNLVHHGAFYVTTSLAWDTTRAALNGLLVLLAGRPVLAVLRRAARRAAFEETVTFGPSRSG